MTDYNSSTSHHTHQHRVFSNSGLSSSVHGHGHHHQDDMSSMDISTASLMSLTFMPVVIESVPRTHQHTPSLPIPNTLAASTLRSDHFSTISTQAAQSDLEKARPDSSSSSSWLPNTAPALPKQPVPQQTQALPAPQIPLVTRKVPSALGNLSPSAATSSPLHANGRYAPTSSRPLSE